MCAPLSRPLALSSAALEGRHTRARMLQELAREHANDPTFVA